MELIPAIDLNEGQCVRLYQGRFDEVTHYPVAPAALARRYRDAGARWLHVVDLDGARYGTPANTATIAAILAASDIRVQVGGGLRTLEAVETQLAAGAERVVIGSLAVREPATVGAWLERLGPERIVLALDVRLVDGVPMTLTHGWTEASASSLWQVLDGFLPHGLRHVLCTDVELDGAMQGPNLTLYRECCNRYPTLAVQASGGVRDAEDLAALAGTGAAGAISGRALLEGALPLEGLEAFLPDHVPAPQHAAGDPAC
ncbi:MAG: 1-(5-phosphoribosyl)-5-[(5-phosphoribosylamino)methylideneamino]imidazole-4-carboxamide isomerase [Gammaproteobacteria bacterium]|nr:1-(5-phosphoribosyl)-5-[(5-phosphoribosylamino)methylideneamino]imidazole-4-carboxamide isomerase [Gammaproteobacteria bacterium]TVQ48813.1 MAG: 1-(5-phosphoribosyl)-5-[(5-phosphoribosylamino)methylideneamino]imidazole-4-carboxamide isomerase [Gammaproteobacteria bacterium]